MTTEKGIKIPDGEIEKLEKALGITRDEAIETWLFDNGYEENEEVDKLTEEAKKVRRYEKSDTPRKKSTRVRKVDEEKAKLLKILANALENENILTTSHNEAEISFNFNEFSYTVKLIKHRPKK